MISSSGSNYQNHDYPNTMERLTFTSESQINQNKNIEKKDPAQNVRMEISASHKISPKLRWKSALHSIHTLNSIAGVRDFLTRGKRLAAKSETSSNTHAIDQKIASLQIGNNADTTFNTLRTSTSPAAMLSIPPAGEWKAPSPAELKEALNTASPLFKKHLAANPEAADQWIAKLAQAIEGKQLGSQHKGVELYLRFKLAYYKMIHHLAYGTMWRSSEGKLKVAFLHQESVDPAHGSRTHTGRFLKNFDSEHILRAAAINKKIAECDPITTSFTEKLLSIESPVDQSMNMVGLPDINVFSAKHPNLLAPITDAMCNADTEHPYGLFEGYSDRLANKPDVQHINCFAATEMASKAVQGGEFSYPSEDAVPHCVTRLAQLTCTDVDGHFKEVEIKGKKIKLEDIAKDPNLGRKIAVHLGRSWGESSAWDVPGQSLAKVEGKTS